MEKSGRYVLYNAIKNLLATEFDWKSVRSCVRVAARKVTVFPLETIKYVGNFAPLLQLIYLKLPDSGFGKPHNFLKFYEVYLPLRDVTSFYIIDHNS